MSILHRSLVIGARAASLLLAAVMLSPAASSAAAQSVAVEQIAAVGVRPVRFVDVGVQRLGSEVSIHVDGASQVAHIEIQEEFRNFSGRVLEGDYLYPIPRGAVFENLSLFMGETEMRGEMLQADQARAIYEEIVRKRKDPALVELIGSSVIRARVFPIEPGDTRKVILRFTQVLSRDGSVLRLRYPRAASLIVTGDEGPEPVLRTQRSQRLSAVAQGSFALRVRVDGARRFGTPFSPTNAIDVSRPSADVAEVVMRPESGNAGDFELLLPLLSSDVGISLLTHSPAPDSEDGYFMMVVSPPASSGDLRIARDMTLVLDVSGSMSGHKIEQARSALEQILNSLGADDRFRLITFSSVVRAFESDFVTARSDRVRDAVAWLRATPADGSTNLYDALEMALQPPTREGRLSLVVFLTDGMPTVSETDPERIADAADRLRDGERVFAFGVGEDVNTYLLDRMAQGGRGTVSYVLPSEDVEAAVSSLTRKINAPVLTNLRIAGAPATLEDTYPGPLPDLFAGEDLMLLGRYRNEGSGELVLEGDRGGERLRFAFPVQFPRRESDNGFVTRLWAARKAGALTAQIRMHGANAEVIEEIRELGLRYGVLTEYTSYLVLEPGMVGRMEADEMGRRINAAAPAPSMQTGAESFRKSRATSMLNAAQSVAEAEEALADAMGPVGGDRDDASASWSRVGRRLFVLRDGAWADARVDDAAPQLSVAPYSEAWFDLLVRLPGLRQAAGLGDRVMIAGEDMVLRLEPEGRTTLGAADWRRLEAAFAADRS